MIEAKIILDSVSPHGIRLTTIQTKAPKFLDAEFEKHRMISSNSSSDRAIPLLKMLDSGYYLPDDIRLNQPGMQGDLLLSEDEKEEFWCHLRSLYGFTQSVLKQWDKVHKQHLNRYLIGLSWQHKVCTATEWDNFFELRLNPAADPAMYQLAKCIKEAMDASTPKLLQPEEWHVPYLLEHEQDGDNWFPNTTGTQIKCSVARCARVSYNNHDDTEPSVSKDLALYDKLLKSKHMSPFEHQARPMVAERWGDLEWEKGITHSDRQYNYWSANFRGWIQNRKLID